MVGCDEFMVEFIGAEVPTTVSEVVPSGSEVALLATEVMLTCDEVVVTENRSVSGFGLTEWESPMPTCSST